MLHTVHCVSVHHSTVGLLCVSVSGLTNRMSKERLIILPYWRLLQMPLAKKKSISKVCRSLQ